MSVEQLEHRIRETVDACLSRVRRDLDAQIEALTTDLLRLAQESQRNARAVLERAVSEVREDAEQSYRVRLDSMRGELTREIEARLAAARTTPQSGGVDPRFAIRQGRVDALERLLSAVRRIDEAMTLSAILDALAKGTAAATSRVAVLVVEADTLKTWARFGFESNDLPAELPIGHSGVLSAAVALRQTSFVPPSVDTRETVIPAFMRVPMGHTGLVTPVVVADEVVAVVYADDVGRGAEQNDPRVWSEEIELLVRHTAARLENVTSERTVEVLTRPA
jgi:hypothetical protein